jgi:hypothetical protein
MAYKICQEVIKYPWLMTLPVPHVMYVWRICSCCFRNSVSFKFKKASNTILYIKCPAHRILLPGRYGRVSKLTQYQILVSTKPLSTKYCQVTGEYDKPVIFVERPTPQLPVDLIQDSWHDDRTATASRPTPRCKKVQHKKSLQSSADCILPYGP